MRALDVTAVLFIRAFKGVRGLEETSHLHFNPLCIAKLTLLRFDFMTYFTAYLFEQTLGGERQTGLGEVRRG